MPGAEQRPGRPVEKHAAFNGAGLPGAGGQGERQGSDLSRNAPMPPIAANLVSLMKQAREERLSRGYTEFYPQWWMYTKMVEVSASMSDRNEDVSNTLFGLSYVYGIAAYPHFTPRQKDQFRQNLRSGVQNLNIGNVTLDERQRELLAHITVATSTPFDPNQSEYAFATVLQQPDISEKEMEQDPRYNT